MGDASLVIYYGIVSGTLEWRMDIQEDDWSDFMNLVNRYLTDDIEWNQGIICMPY